MSYQLSITPQEIEKLPLAAFEGKIHVISELGEEFENALKYLRRQKVLGFDTESKPVFTPGMRGNGVALVQLSGKDEAFLFRVQKLGMLSKLCHIFADPFILKVGAASSDDVRGLQRVQAFTGRKFVDLQKLVWEYGIKDKSVKKMAAIILGVRISKTQQLSNWEAPVLSDAQLKYAATDAWICREMYLKLRRSRKEPLSSEQMMPPEQLLKIAKK